jgi:hypothetical protein
LGGLLQFNFSLLAFYRKVFDRDVSLRLKREAEPNIDEGKNLTPFLWQTESSPSIHVCIYSHFVVFHANIKLHAQLHDSITIYFF